MKSSESGREREEPLEVLLATVDERAGAVLSQHVACPGDGFVRGCEHRAASDLFRDTVTLPVAFTAAKEAEKHPDEEIERIARRLAAKTLRQKRIVLSMIDRIKELLDDEKAGEPANA